MAQQQAPPASVPPNPFAGLVEQLTAQTNLVYAELGRVAHKENLRTPMGIAPSNQRLRTTIPGAVDRYHDILDKIENEVFWAQVVLRRDLAEVQEARQRREQEAAAEIERKAREEAEAAKLSTPAAAPSAGTQPRGESGSSQTSQSGVQAVNGNANDASNLHIDTGTNGTSSAAEADSADNALCSISAQEAQPGSRSAIDEQLFGRTPTSADFGSGMDFDSMFDELGGDSAGGDGATAPNRDAGPFGTGDNQKPTDGGGENPTGMQDTVSSLLPGLDNYAAVSGKAGAQGNTGDGLDSLMFSDGQGDNQSSFEDLLAFEDSADGGIADGGGGMTGFDDDFFKF
ncbi:hypothetical protein BDY21DRAFT_360149 [Lineolata rhizophorae]|uniref:Uncharacterized protein n=1 Tax=Lineolata rhizophorae TaxID=578093 RepID=A0A6A6PDW3_9PEZI|nr:hypothetical protein BDY21DRAFT_360149 [Lineolata rhizophorae]